MKAKAAKTTTISSFLFYISVHTSKLFSLPNIYHKQGNANENISFRDEARPLPYERPVYPSAYNPGWPSHEPSYAPAAPR
jgi:hypothetical protein